MSQRRGLDFVVNKSAWHDTRWVEPPVSTDLAPGQVLFRVDRFAFTANNITYALAGDMLNYWRFFPTEDGWGRLIMRGRALAVGGKKRMESAPGQGTRVIVELEGN